MPAQQEFLGPRGGLVHLQVVNLGPLAVLEVLIDLAAGKRSGGNLSKTHEEGDTQTLVRWSTGIHRQQAAEQDPRGQRQCDHKECAAHCLMSLISPTHNSHLLSVCPFYQMSHSPIAWGSLACHPEALRPYNVQVQLTASTAHPLHRG